MQKPNKFGSSIIIFAYTSPVLSCAGGLNTHVHGQALQYGHTEWGGLPPQCLDATYSTQVQTTSLATSPSTVLLQAQRRNVNCINLRAIRKRFTLMPPQFYKQNRIRKHTMQTAAQRANPILSSPFMNIRHYESHSLGNRTAIVMPRLCHCTLFYTLTMPAIRQLLCSAIAIVPL